MTLSKKIEDTVEVGVMYGGQPEKLYTGGSFSQCCGSRYHRKQNNPKGIALIPFIFGKERQASASARTVNTLKHIKSKNGDFTVMVREKW